MYNPTSMSHWVASLRESITAVHVRHSSGVKSLFLWSLDRCIENMHSGVHMCTLSVPTNLLNFLFNKAMRYDVDLSHLLSCLAHSGVTKLELTNFGVGRCLPVSFYAELSLCTNLSHLDLYGFELELSQFHKLRSLTNLVSISLGDNTQCVFSRGLIETLTCFKLTILHLRNFIIDFKELELFPFLTTLSLSKCIQSQSAPPERGPPLRCLAVSYPVIEFGSLHMPVLSFHAPTLHTLRLSFVTLAFDTLFTPLMFPLLTELEMAFCKLENAPPDRDGLLWGIHTSCPSLSQLTFLSHTSYLDIGSELKPEDPPFEIVSRSSTPAVLMELNLHHFHNPETAFRIANLKPTGNTFFWGRGKMGNRAAVSPHFLILANLLYLNPTEEHAGDTLTQLEIRSDLWDLEIICGEDYLIPLAHCYRQSVRCRKLVASQLRVAAGSNCVDSKRREGIVAGILDKK